MEGIKKMLTKQKLMDMKPGQIFRTGTENEPRIYDGPIRWIAKRGEGFHDWTIYYHHENMTTEYIAAYGDKLFSKDIIKELVPCDDEAFGLYRF